MRIASGHRPPAILHRRETKGRVGSVSNGFLIFWRFFLDKAMCVHGVRCFFATSQNEVVVAGAGVGWWGREEGKGGVGSPPADRCEPTKQGSSPGDVT